MGTVKVWHREEEEDSGDYSAAMDKVQTNIKRSWDELGSHGCQHQSGKYQPRNS